VSGQVELPLLAQETSNQLGIPVLSNALVNRRLISPMSGVG
jgi:hypothetical protein